MNLAGQDGGRSPADAGYAMAGLLVGIAVMGVLLAVAMPVWRQQMVREKEAELVFRGEQYARAIALYQRKLGPGSLPPSVDVLVEQRFLRKEYEDPMSEDGEFQILYASQQAGGSSTGRGGTPSDETGGQQQAGTQTSGASGVRGGVIGVTSKSTDASIRVYNGASRYNEWQFLYTQFAAQPGQQPGQPGLQPGQRGGSGQRGGQRGRGAFGSGQGAGRGQRGSGQGPGRGGTGDPGMVRPPAGGRGPGG
jgi:type II secretory pathway pseudopilin PulG